MRLGDVWRQCRPATGSDTARVGRLDLLTEIRTALPAAAALKDISGGLSGSNAAIITDADGTPSAFGKWSTDPVSEAAGQIRDEGVNLRRVVGLSGVASTLYFDPDVPVLVTEFIPQAADACWDNPTWSAASTTLKALREVDPADLPLVRDWNAFRDRGTVTYDALLACTRDRNLSAVFEASYHAVREDSDHSAVCHSDTHPDNWVLSPQGPVLVDFAWLARGPAGFDETFLLAHLNAPTAERLRWLEMAGVEPAVARMVAGAVATRLALGSHGPAGPWREWCVGRWDAAFAFAAALR